MGKTNKLEKETEMKLTEMYPSNLLKAADVTDAGGEMLMKIASVEMKEFDQDGGGKETKPVMVFTDDKRMVLNKTNANNLASMFGNDTDLWIGKEVTLISQDVSFADKIVPAIRFKNLNTRDALIQRYWATSRERGMTNPEGLKHLKEFNQDFAAALDALLSPF